MPTTDPSPQRPPKPTHYMIRTDRWIDNQRVVGEQVCTARDLGGVLLAEASMPGDLRTIACKPHTPDPKVDAERGIR